MNQEYKIREYKSELETQNRGTMLGLFRDCPIPEQELLQNLGLFIKRQDLTQILFKNELYQHILDVNGVVMEFGVRWGQSLSLFESFRGIYEPYNYRRKIIGFDTFEGFPSIHEKDGKSSIAQVGAYSVSENYEEYLAALLQCHENESPLSHIKKFELVKGDAMVQLEKYLHDNPQTIISLAYFDFDIYEPTFKCLSLIKDYITRGTVIGFDELNHPDFPGETVAVREALGLSKYKIRRSKFSSLQSYVIVD